MQVAELFNALGDPTRLKMIERLSSNRSYTITTISSGLNISRQGARKHLKTLEEAKLVVLNVRGRDTFVLLDKKSLEKCKDFISKLEKQWENRLERLKEFVESKN